MGEDVSVGESVGEDVSVGESVGDVVSVGESVGEDVSVGESVGEDVSVGESVGEDVSVGESVGVGESDAEDDAEADGDGDGLAEPDDEADELADADDDGDDDADEVGPDGPGVGVRNAEAGGASSTAGVTELGRSADEPECFAAEEPEGTDGDELEVSGAWDVAAGPAAAGLKGAPPDDDEGRMPLRARTRATAAASAPPAIHAGVGGRAH